jgi:hypothetical protein
MATEKMQNSSFEPRISELDKSDIRRLAKRAPNLETFIEDVRMIYSFQNFSIPEKRLPESPEERELLADNVIKLNEPYIK